LLWLAAQPKFCRSQSYGKVTWQLTYVSLSESLTRSQALPALVEASRYVFELGRGNAATVDGIVSKYCYAD
jgi:hypothetical protein